MIRKALPVILLITLPHVLYAQEKGKDQNKKPVYALNEDGSHYLKASFVSQTWVRYTWNNPGTTLDGYIQDETYDIGLRRTRFIVQGQLTDRVYFFIQIGQNNLTFSSPRKQPLFIHDAFSEYQLADELAIGAGLSGWNGPSRYSSPAIGSIMTLDAPLYQQSTNDVNDQFLRNFSVYAKGKIRKLDYRLALTKPMTVINSTQDFTVQENALFSVRPPKMQYQGYFMYQFLDQESNNTPYTQGTYLGAKSIFNIGAGFLYQPDAMWRSGGARNADIITDLQLFAVDLFYDRPLNGKGNVITAYACYTYSDYGKNYVRNIGVMNPANGMRISNIANGPGNAFPAIGTGSTVYAQFGYLPGKAVLGDHGTLQPFVAGQYSDFQLFNEPMLMYEAGFNWLIDQHNAKVSFEYQGRPVFFENGINNYEVLERKGMLVMQIQVAI